MHPDTTAPRRAPAGRSRCRDGRSSRFTSSSGSTSTPSVCPAIDARARRSGCDSRRTAPRRRIGRRRRPRGTCPSGKCRTFEAVLGEPGVKDGRLVGPVRCSGIGRCRNALPNISPALAVKTRSGSPGLRRHHFDLHAESAKDADERLPLRKWPLADRWPATGSSTD